GQGAYCGLGPPRDHDISLSSLDDLKGVTDRVGARGARSHGARVVALRPDHDRNLPRRDIGDHHRHKEGTHPIGSLFKQVAALFFKGVNAPDPRTDEHADAFPVDIVGDGCVLERHPGARHGKLRETIHPPRVLAVHKVRRIEVFHFGGDASGKTRSIEAGDRTDARTPLDQALPKSVDTDPERTYSAHTRDDDTSVHPRSPPRDRGTRSWCLAPRMPASKDARHARQGQVGTYPTLAWKYSTASPTGLIFSASSSGISKSNSSSKAMTSSTMSKESAPRSSINDASSVTSSASTPSCSTTNSLTRSMTSTPVTSLQNFVTWPARHRRRAYAP